MAKTRIHEFAKELNMENKDLLKLLEKMGLVFKNVHSTLEESDVERVKNQINLSRKEGVVEQRVKPTIIRRRVKREEAVPPIPEPAVMEKGLPPEAKKAPIIEVAKPAAKKAEERVEAPLSVPEEVKAPPPPTVIPGPPVAPLEPSKPMEFPIAEVTKKEEVIQEVPPIAAQEAVPPATEAAAEMPPGWRNLPLR